MEEKVKTAMQKGRVISILLFYLFTFLPLSAQSRQEVLQTAQKANDYFMAKYADPTIPTNVKKIRPSSLWTRAVYYEGLMALNAIDPKDAYLDYAFRWADFHQWTPRNGVKTTDADDQCCAQTYIEYQQLTGKGTLEPTKENLAKQMASGRTDYWTWIDAIQMAMPVYVKMYAITGDKQYLDYAMKSYLWSRNTCGGGLFNVKRTMCRLTRRKTERTVIGVVATVGCMQHWSVVWTCCPPKIKFKAQSSKFKVQRLTNNSKRTSC